MTSTPASVDTPAPHIGGLLKMLTVVAVVAGVALRLWPRTSLWLDEALSVNIASLPVKDIPEALRHDGHPPLYYFLLHFWMLLDSSDWWIRLFSALIGFAALPLAYVAGTRIGERASAAGLGAQRVGLIVLALYAVMPYGVRYSSEARMYSLMSLLVLIGYLLVDELLSESRVRRGYWLPATALALTTAALLYSHYWAIWIGTAVGILAVVQAVKAVDPRLRRRSLACVGSLIVGVLLYLPWVPNMAFQSEHTGTPWGEVFRPATILVVTITDFVGGGFGEVQVITYLLIAAIGVALFGVLRQRAGRQVVELTATAQLRIIPELYVFLTTVAIAWLVSVAASATYASRYAAVIYPLFVLMVGAGLAMARSKKVTALLVAITLVASLAGAIYEIGTDRTQAGVVAGSIEDHLAAAGAQTGTVISCPDQLAPATARALDNAGADARVVPFPTGENPEIVDWVDYEERNSAADPTAFAEEVLSELPEDEPVYFVMNPSYLTFEGKCEQLLAALTNAGVPLSQVISTSEDYFETMGLWSAPPNP